MEIRKVGKTSVSLTTDHATVLVFPNESSIKGGEWSLVLGAKEGAKFGIETQGEYETSEVWTMAINTDPNEPKNNIYVLLVNGIRVGVLESDVPLLNKKQIDKIGLIDVLVANVSSNTKELVDNIGEIEPKILVPVNFSEEGYASLVKDLGVTNVTEEKRIKVKHEDFIGDDYQLQIVKLLN